MKLIFIFRKSYPNQFSIENVFETICNSLTKTIEVQRFKTSYPSSGVWNRIKIIIELRKCKGDVFHLTGDINFGIIGLLNKKSVLTIHDLIFLRGKNALERFMLVLFWVKLPAFFVKRGTVISNSTLVELRNIIPGYIHKFKVISNPLTVNEENVLAAKKQNPLINSNYVLLIGTKSNKNITAQVKAIENTQSLGTIVIVGGETEEVISLKSKSQLQIVLLNKLKKSALYNLYLNANFLSFCSYEEGFGLPILEAQILGCPVVTSNCSSMPEVAGVAALFANPYNPLDIEKQIKSIVSNVPLRKGLIAKGYKNVERFKPEVIAQQYLDLYHEVAQL